MKLVLDMEPKEDNGRNSEGSFIRLPDDSILFAYSRFTSNSAEDEDGCDIAVIRSFDEGETWTEPEIIVPAESLGVHNIMSVSCVYQNDGSIGVYFLAKQKDGTTRFARALSSDGKMFVAEECVHDGYPANYIVNNDRVVRFMDGRLILPAAQHLMIGGNFDAFAVTVLFASEDDGKTFHQLPHRFAIASVYPGCVGMQEPGVMEHKDGSVRVWARTRHDSQYESFSYDNMKTFTWPGPSFFSSPNSPMEIARNEQTGVLYAVYNPYPRSKLDSKRETIGRTPLIVRKSFDDGETWSLPVVIEDEKDRGYCYPSMFFTKDNSMLCAYCRGGVQDYNCLARLGITKISLDEI